VLKKQGGQRVTATDLPQGMTRNTISLLLGHPDPATLLTAEFQAAIQNAMSQPRSYAALQYGPEQGTPRLIQFLVDRFNREQQPALRPEQVMIVAGSTHAVDMITRLYARPRGVVLVEAPTYADSIHIFRDHQVELRAMPMDENGLLIPELEKTLAALKAEGNSPTFLYTIPNFHNPTGITTSEARRIETIRLARQYRFLIVEDDVYRELSFEGTVPRSYYALANGEGVLSIGSFSKTLAPGLRLGWLFGSPEAIQRFVTCGTTQMGGGANPFAAHIVAEYCCEGHWEAHIARLRALYRRRCDVALGALREYMPKGVTWTQPAGGFFLWLTLPQSVLAQQVKQAALQAGVLVAAGNGFFVNSGDGDHNLRLAFSFAAPADIEAGIRILGQVIGQLSTSAVAQQ
jgi:DNA-binding transcriptional MocR family regulator